MTVSIAFHTHRGFAGRGRPALFGRSLTGDADSSPLQRASVRPVPRTSSWVHEREDVNGVAEQHVDDEMRKPPNRMSATHVRDAPEDRIAMRSVDNLLRALSHLEQKIEAKPRTLSSYRSPASSSSASASGSIISSAIAAL